MGTDGVNWREDLAERIREVNARGISEHGECFQIAVEEEGDFEPDYQRFYSAINKVNASEYANAPHGTLFFNGCTFDRSGRRLFRYFTYRPSIKWNTFPDPTGPFQELPNPVDRTPYREMEFSDLP